MRAGTDRRAASASALGSDRPITAIGGTAVMQAHRLGTLTPHRLGTLTPHRLATLTPRRWTTDMPDGALQASTGPAVQFTRMNPIIRTGRAMPTKLTQLVPATVTAGLASEHAPSSARAHARAR